MTLLAELIEGRPLIHAAPGERVRDVARRMTDKNVGAVAVLDAGTLVGIFSERDVMARVVAAGLNPDETTVARVMTKDLVVGRPDDDIDAALEKMHAVGCRHLPIVERGSLVGMISIRDLLEIDDASLRKKATFLREFVTYRPDYET